MRILMENLEILKNLFLFNGMKEKQIEAALNKLESEEKKYRKKSLLAAGNQKNPRLGIMLSGSAIEYKDDIWGNREIINHIHEGDTFAEPYAASNLPADICFQALESCRVLWLNISRINFAGNDSILLKVASNLLQIMAVKVLNLNERICHISKSTTKGKVLSFLSTQSQKNNSLEFDIPFDRRQLADYLSVERSAMTAELSKLKQEGLIRTRKSHFTLYP